MQVVWDHKRKTTDFLPATLKPLMIAGCLEIHRSTILRKQSAVPYICSRTRASY